MGNYENLKQSITEVIRTNGNKEITGAVLQSTLLTIISTVGANATFAGIATPSTNPGTPDGPVFWIASESGTYSNFGGVELQDGLSVLMWNGSWSSQQIFGVDNEPTAGSDNLVKSGGVQEELALGVVYDVSAKNPTAGVNNDGKFESLSALLGDTNLDTLIPASVRRGGMSIKFIQSSDNMYVQWRLMADSFSTTISDWQGVDDEPKSGSHNLVESGGVEAILSPILNDEKVTFNKVIGYNGDELGVLMDSTSYDCTIPVRAFGSSLYISGANAFNAIAYSDVPFNHNTAITKIDKLSGIFNIPSNAKYIGINFLKAQNSDGYANIKFVFNNSLVHESGLSKVISVEAKNFALGDYVYGYNGDELGVILLSSTYKATNLINVNNHTQIKVSGATPFNMVCFSDTPASHPNAISLAEKKGNIFILPTGTKYIGLNFLNSQNTDGYASLNISSEDMFMEENQSANIVTYSGTAYGYNGEELGVYLSAGSYTISGLIPISSSRVKVTNARPLNVVCFSDYIVNHSNALAKVEIINGIATIPSGTKYIGINFLNNQNPSGYNNIKLLYDDDIDIADIKSSALTTITDKAMGLVSHIENFNDAKPFNTDKYVALGGDSITAFQSATPLPEEGVTRVPAVCDRKANAYWIWKNLVFGNPQIRRFDDGKASLVADWCDFWDDDSEAVFTETGTFKTEYMGADARTAVGNITAVQYTTHIDYGTFPTQFDNSENNNFSQRNIPKRFSNTASASISFKIPAGYYKFDFIYHAHTLGDNVTISTNRDNGIVKVNTKPNDWTHGSEANGYVVDLSLTPWIEQGGGNDAYGIPNKRLHFYISNPSTDTIVTITKSSDTSKYLIYWGIVYWSTLELPYCVNIDNMAVGGYSMENVYNLRSSMFKAVQPNCIIEEYCLNDLTYKNYVPLYDARTIMQNLKQYLDGLSVPYAVWIPHAGGTRLNSHAELLKMNYRLAEFILEEYNFKELGSLYTLFDRLHKVYYKNITLSAMMINLGDVHLNYDGYQVYDAFWNNVLN